MDRITVAQWGTGAAGMACLKAVIEHPDMDLVAVWVHSDEKAGQDAGELCGLGKTGIAATQDVETVVAAHPDCVLYMADRSDIGVLERLLESGCNVVTARVEFNHRDSIEAGVRRRLEDACRRGNSSLYCTGATPGWFTEQLPLAVAMLERRIRSIMLDDFADMSRSNAPHMLFDVLPFGRDAKALASGAPVATPQMAVGSLSMTAAALGLEVDEFVTTRDFAAARQRVEIAAGTIEAGTVGAMRRSVLGLRDGKPVIGRTSILYVTKDVDAEWQIRDSGQLLRIDGDVPLEVSFTVPPSADPAAAGAMTSNAVVNAAPFVCVAGPGILQTDELPLIVPRFSPRDSSA